MIETNQVLDLLVEACPSFASARDAHVAEYGHEALYVAAGEFARHLLALYIEGPTTCFGQVGVAIERMHTEGTPEVQELATIGILEGIQNAWGNNGVSPDEIAQHFGPETRSWWQGLNNFWSGKEGIVRSGA